MSIHDNKNSDNKDAGYFEFGCAARLKVYVDVIAIFTKDGRLVPSRFIWEDGTEYEITRVTDARRAASLKAGGVGMRYTCLVEGKEVHLFYEDDNHWFMVKRQC